jgi:hypothetical protein
MREWCLVGCAKADTRSFDEPQRSWRRAHALPAASPSRDTSVGAFARPAGTRASQ